MDTREKTSETLSCERPDNVTRKPDEKELTEALLIRAEKDWFDAMIKRVERAIHSSADSKGLRQNNLSVFVKLHRFWLLADNRGSPLALAVLAKKYKDAGWTVEAGYEGTEKIPYIKLS